MLEIGKPAPDFQIPDQDGKMFHLHANFGNPIILYFYPKDDTSACTIENQDFSELAQSPASKDIMIIGISPDAPEKHLKFISKFNLKTRLLSDSDNQVSTAYDAWGMKKNYGREYMGLIRSSVLIDKSGNVAEHVRATRVKGHAQKMLDLAVEL